MKSFLQYLRTLKLSVVPNKLPFNQAQAMDSTSLERRKYLASIATKCILVSLCCVPVSWSMFQEVASAQLSCNPAYASTFQPSNGTFNRNLYTLSNAAATLVGGTASTQNIAAIAQGINQFVDDTTSSHAAVDNNFHWLNNYLLGAIDGGRMKSGNLIEYTIYFLNTGGSNANSTRVCDRISPNQSFRIGAYGGVGNDIQVQIGPNPVQILTAANDASDRAQLYAANAPVPSDCHLNAVNNNGTVVVDVTGSSGTGIPNLTTLSGSTGPGTPNTSYGLIRFTTLVP